MTHALCYCSASPSPHEWNTAPELAQPCPGQRAPAPTADPVNHPQHYTQHPSGVECITITEHMTFNVGNAVKYLWRADLKGDAIEDLRKAAWYLDREVARRLRGGA